MATRLATMNPNPRTNPMGANADYHFIRNCSDVRDAFRCAGGENNVDYAEGYSGTLAECDCPCLTGDPIHYADRRDWIERQWDSLSDSH